MRKFLLFLFVLISPFTFAQWNQLAGPAGAGTIQDLEYISSGNRVYAVADSRLYTTTNDGTSWTKVVPTNGVEIYLSDLLIDGATLYALDYSSFYKSEDNGLTWVRTNIGAAGQFYGTQKITKLGTGTFAVYGWNGIYISTDSGVSWTQISANKETISVRTNANGDLFATDPDGVKKHLKPAVGQPWTAAGLTVVKANTSTLFHNQLAIDATGNIYALTSNPNTGSNFDVVRSTDGGVNWLSIRGTGATALAIPTTDGVWQYSYHFFGFAPDGKLYLATGVSGNKLHVTNNPSVATATSVAWSVATANPISLRSDPSVSAMVFASATKAFIGTYGDGILLTTNLAATGTTWAYRSEGILSTYGKEIEVAGTRILMLSNGGNKGFYQSTNGGATWTFVEMEVYINFLRKMPNGTIIAYGYNGLFYSGDNGSTWSAKIPQGFEDIEATPTNVLYASAGNDIRVSSDNGDTWPTTLTITGMPTTYYVEGNRLALDASGGLDLFRVIYNQVNSQREIYKITVSGSNGTATKLTMPSSYIPSDWVNSIEVNEGKLYVSQYNNIFISSDKGNTWSTVSYSNQKIIPISGGICVSNYGSLYITQDDGLSWNNTSFPTNSNIFIQDIAVDASGDFYAAGVNGGALKNTQELVVPPSSLPPYINFNWQPTGGPYGGEVLGLMKDNANTVYAYQYDKYFKANPAATSWQLINFPTNYYLNAVEVKKSTGELFGTSYERNFKSVDGGANWTLFNSENIQDRRKTIILPNGNAAMVASNKIYVSTDGGVTFGAPKYTFGSNESYYQYDQAFIATSNNVIMLEVYDNTTQKEKFKRSIDNGATWTDVPAPGSNASQIVRTTVDGSGNIYVVNWDGPFKSSDNGTTWTYIKGNITNGWGYQARISVSPTNELFFPTFGGGGANNTQLMKSTDGGTTWTSAGNTPLEIFDLTWVGTKMVAATINGIITSIDNGVTWVNASTGITLLDTTDLLQAKQNRLLVAAYTASYTSNDNGTNWVKSTYDFKQFFTLPDGSIVGLVRNGDKGYRSTDQGDTWTQYFTFSEFGQQYFSPNGTDHYIRTYYDIYYSNNLTTWTKLTISGFPPDNQRFLNDLAADSNGIIYVLLYNYTSNKDEAYQVLFGSASLLNQATNPRSLGYYQGKIYLFGSEGSLSSTEDGGTWVKRSVPGGNKFIVAARDYYFIPSNNNTLWLSRDLGQTWQSVGLNVSGDYTFKDVILNEFDGYAYAILRNSVVRKSGNIVIPDDATAPVAASFYPANNATNIAIDTTLTITFDEAVIPQAGKTLRILDLANATIPIHTFNVTDGVQVGKSFTYTLPSALSYLKTYFLVMDAAAFKDIFGNNSAGILNNSTWRFTTIEEPDTQKPAITFTTSNLEKGVSKSFSVTITDNKSLPADSTFIYYRGITTAATANFTKAKLTAGTGTTSRQFTIDASESWYDAMGLEFYFETADGAGNKERSPSTAGSYHYSYISFTNDNTYPVLNPVLSFGGATSNYRIISVPYKLSNASITTLFDEVNGGAVDKTQWRVFTLGSGTSYTEPTSFSYGKGYWVNVRNNPGNITIEGSQTPEYNRTKFVDFTLTPGWNMIGNPYPVAISWNQAKSGNAAVGAVQTFAGSTYAPGDILQPMQGGFVFVSGTASQTVKIRFQGITSGGRVAEEMGSDLSKPNWVLPIKTESAGLSNEIGGIGMHERAIEGLDEFDNLNPPRFLTMAELSFPKKDVSIAAFAKDVIPTRDEYVWKFDVEGGEGLITLTWNNDLIIPDGNDLILFDKTHQKLIDMIAVGTYQFNPTQGNSFEIHFGKGVREKIFPSIIHLEAPYPNPVQTETMINFALPDGNQGYQINLEVFNSNGQRVADLANGKYAPGFYQAQWAPESNANGLYFVRLHVMTGGTPVILTEKLIINK